MLSIPSILAMPSLPRRYRPLNIVLSDPANPDLVCAETRAAISLWRRQLAEDLTEAMHDAITDLAGTTGQNRVAQAV